MSKVNNSKSDSKINENHQTFVKNEANRDPVKKADAREEQDRLSVKESDKVSAYKRNEIKKTRKSKSEEREQAN